MLGDSAAGLAEAREQAPRGIPDRLDSLEKAIEDLVECTGRLLEGVSDVLKEEEPGQGFPCEIVSSESSGLARRLAGLEAKCYGLACGVRAATTRIDL